MHSAGSGVTAAGPLPPAQGGCVTGLWMLQPSADDDGIAAYAAWNNSTGNFSTSLTPGRQASIEIVYMCTI